MPKMLTWQSAQLLMQASVCAITCRHAQFHSITECKLRTNSTLSLTSALDDGGWLTPRPGCSTSDPLPIAVLLSLCRSRNPDMWRPYHLQWAESHENPEPYSTGFPRACSGLQRETVPRDVFFLQLCTPKVVGAQFNLYVVYKLHLK